MKLARMQSILRRIYHTLPRPPSTNYNYHSLKTDPYAYLPEHGTVLDVGGKDVRGCYVFGKPPESCKLICLDIEPGPGVDLVADAHNLEMLSDNSIDCVVAVSALEHMEKPWLVVAELYRVLKPGGIIYLNTPFVFPFHGDPDDFYRFSHHGLVKICCNFERLDSGFNRGPASTTTHILIHFLAISFSFNSKLLYGIMVDMFTWLLFWIKYFDRFVAKYQQAYVIHSGAFFIGRKPHHPDISQTYEPIGLDPWD
ncbi:MAG: class I SAM-dependent methyltransferase [Magnetococcales bacterium]|nr:class I SAM-dependent methyltransferase [Magnetococcales bacterium]